MRMLTCREASRRVSLSMDQRLPLHQLVGLWFHLIQRLRLKTHLTMCKYCRRFRKQLHIIRDLSTRQEDVFFEALPAEGLPRDAADRIKNRLKAFSE